MARTPASPPATSPAGRHRCINGSYWLGGVGGSLLAVLMLNTSIFPTDLGWRLSFVLGAVIGLAVLLVRRNVPESPRWLFIHGREEEAEKIVKDIEGQVRESTGRELPEPEGEKLTVRQRKTIPLPLIVRSVVSMYPRRTIVGLSLFIGQAFLYNSILFGYTTVLATFLGLSTGDAPYYLVAFAAGNLVGPLVLGPLFDSIGRKQMISTTYLLSGVLLLITGLLFQHHVLTATTLTIAWMVVFFFASAGASAAYLTVSEIFPMETRAISISVFYAVGTGAGGIIGPLLFAKMVATKNATDVFWALALGAGLMIIGGIVELLLGVRAERKGLEEIALPLTAADAEAEAESESVGKSSGGAGTAGALAGT